MADDTIIEGQSRLITGAEVAASVVRKCGNCHFGKVFREGLAVVTGASECWGSPPIPVIMGQGPGGAAIGLMRPRVPNTDDACALWKLKLAIAS